VGFCSKLGQQKEDYYEKFEEVKAVITPPNLSMVVAHYRDLRRPRYRCYPRLVSNIWLFLKALYLYTKRL
jgi:hypothetical protein